MFTGMILGFKNVKEMNAIEFILLLKLKNTAKIHQKPFVISDQSAPTVIEWNCIITLHI